MSNRLKWKLHIIKKSKIRYNQQMPKLINKKKIFLSLNTKVLILKIRIFPIWTYSIKLWRCATQRCQSKILIIIRMRYVCMLAPQGCWNQLLSRRYWPEKLAKGFKDNGQRNWIIVAGRLPVWYVSFILPHWSIDLLILIANQ